PGRRPAVGALTADAVALEAPKNGESQPATPASVDLDQPNDPNPSLTARPPGARGGGGGGGRSPPPPPPPRPVAPRRR
ncbi:hypothetical protein, partial [Nocardia brasiliensis]|uniref:hypothetical protein n=1 Tax=Nocardia brasiliensis TaxID=37326 RepID=UPI0024558AC8